MVLLLALVSWDMRAERVTKKSTSVIQILVRIMGNVLIFGESIFALAQMDIMAPTAKKVRLIIVISFLVRNSYHNLMLLSTSLEVDALINRL